MDVWDIYYNNKCMKATGNRRLFDFIKYLASTPLDNIPARYQRIEQQLDKIFVLPQRPADVYEYLVQKEYKLSKYMIRYIDEEFLDSKLKELNIVDNIQIIFSSFKNGSSASAERYGSHSLIRLDLFKFISWVDDLKVAQGTSIGNNGCKSVLGCILRTVAHECVHAILVLSIDTIIDNDKIIVRDKDFFKHIEMVHLIILIGEFPVILNDN